MFRLDLLSYTPAVVIDSFTILSLVAFLCASVLVLPNKAALDMKRTL